MILSPVTYSIMATSPIRDAIEGDSVVEITNESGHKIVIQGTHQCEDSFGAKRDTVKISSSADGGWDSLANKLLVGSGTGSGTEGRSSHEVDNHQHVPR
jgi:hypothetical protein